MIRSSAVLRPADNPFSSRCIDTLAFRSHDGGTDSLLERLQKRRGRGAIIGPHGSGKTTLLEELARRLQGKVVWVRLNADHVNPGETARRCLPDLIDQRHVILIDGAEQLGACAWWWFNRRLRNAGAIVITGHRRGRFPTIHECTTSPGLLVELVAELAPEIGEAVDLEELYERHKGDIRMCFRELYDVWAGR